MSVSVLPGEWSENACLGFPYPLVALDGRVWSPSFPSAHDRLIIPPLLVCLLCESLICLSLPRFPSFAPHSFLPLSSPTGFLCRSRCRNSLLHINELLISKAKRRPASCLLPPAASRTLRSLTRSLPLVLSHTLSHTRSATLFAWWADNWYAEVHGDLSRESGDITNLSESLALLPVPAALLGGYSQRVHPNKFFQLLRVICSFMDVHTNTRDHRLTVSVLLAKCTSLFSPSLISIFEWYHSFVKVNIVNTEQQWSHLG